MSHGTLHWDDWYRTDGFRYHSQQNSYQAVDFGAIFYGAMRDIERVIPSLQLYTEIEKMLQGGIVPFGWQPADAQKLFAYGNFSFGVGSRRGYLCFEGPDVPEDIEDYAGVQRGTLRIRINLYNLIELASTDFTSQTNAVARLQAYVGAVVLHEVAHVEGFHHDAVNGADDLPDSLYDQTLNEVVGQAFCNLFFNDMTFLTGIPGRAMNAHRIRCKS